MAHHFCDHLDEYGAQYIRTEASYKQCVNLLDRLMNDGPAPELVELVTTALREWATEDNTLRQMLLDAVSGGQVRVPRGILSNSSARERNRAKTKSHPVCSTCHFVVPRLIYPEWTFAHNGAASFRGVPVPGPDSDFAGH